MPRLTKRILLRSINSKNEMKFFSTSLALIYFLLIPCLSIAQIDHVEPPNWWVGMKNPNLQLLIKGKNVGLTTPQINYAGVTLKKVSKADSKNYLFLDLEISNITKPGNFIINFKRDGETVYTYNYMLLSRQKDAPQLKGFNSSDVICLIVPDRFANGDYSNDVVAGMKENKINRSFDGGRHGGDIRGIINHLDYLADLGYTAIWPTPLLENDMIKYSYHGYSITNHYKVDPRFGTLDDYKELSAKAKQKGMKLIFDEVVNHIGLYYWWMNDLPFKNWINYPDTLVLSNHRRTINEDRYASQYDSKLMTEGWFDSTMPDMNGQNPFVQNYLTQCSIWWIETLQLGGIRQDTYCYSDKTFLKNWSCSVMSEYPDFNIVGEEWSLNPLITSYWQKGKKNIDGYESCLPSVMDFPLNAVLTSSLLDTNSTQYGNGITKLYEALANDFVYANPYNILVMCDNHDMDRIYTQLNEDVALTKMALTFILTIRGIPEMVYGTEILMTNSEHKNNHGVIRSDFPGGWKEDKVNAFDKTGLTNEQLSMQAWFKKLLNWRKNNDAIANGKTLHFAPFDNIYVYFRYTNEKTIMVVMNKNNKAVSFDTSRFEEILKTKSSAKNVMTNENFGLNNQLTVEPKTVAIFEIK